MQFQTDSILNILISLCFYLTFYNLFIYLYLNIYIFIYIYVYIFIHIYIYIYIYIYFNIFFEINVSMFPYPTAPEVRISGGSDIHVQLGDVVTLTCVISNALKQPGYVFWYQVQKPILNLVNSNQSNRNQIVYTIFRLIWNSKRAMFVSNSKSIGK